MAVADPFESQTRLRLFALPWAMERAVSVIGADNARPVQPAVVRAFTAMTADLACIQHQAEQRPWLSQLSEQAEVGPRAAWCPTATRRKQVQGPERKIKKTKCAINTVILVYTVYFLSLPINGVGLGRFRARRGRD